MKHSNPKIEDDVSPFKKNLENATPLALELTHAGFKIHAKGAKDITNQSHICPDCGEECRCMGNGELCGCERD